MSDDPDLQLVKLCQSGHVSAFEQLVRRHKQRIYGIVYRMIGSMDEVDDLAQEVFLKAYKHIDTFQQRASFATWLTQIAVNCCINHLRSQRKRRLLSLKIFSQKGIAVEPQTTAEITEKCEKVQSAINALSPKHRAVIILHYFEEYSCEEIGDILGCSTGTVKSRLFHARRMLKKKLEPYLKDGEWLNSISEVGDESYETFKM